MHKRGEKETTGRVEWMETSVRGDLRQKDSCKRGREGIQDTETYNDVLFEYNVTNKKTGGSAGCSRNENFKLFTGNENGQD